MNTIKFLHKNEIKVQIAKFFNTMNDNFFFTHT